MASIPDVTSHDDKLFTKVVSEDPDSLPVTVARPRALPTSPGAPQRALSPRDAEHPRSDDDEDMPAEFARACNKMKWCMTTFVNIATFAFFLATLSARS